MHNSLNAFCDGFEVQFLIGRCTDLGGISGSSKGPYFGWVFTSQSRLPLADTGNIRAMFEGINKAIGPTPTQCATLKSLNGEIIQDKAKQLERWAEHQITNQQKLGTYQVLIRLGQKTALHYQWYQAAYMFNYNCCY